jgi:hypothetical protein
MSIKYKSRFYRETLLSEVHAAVMKHSENVLFNVLWEDVGNIGIYITAPEIAGFPNCHEPEITPLLLCIYPYDFKDGSKRCLTKIRLNGVTKTLGPIYLDKHNFLQFCADAVKIYVKIIEDGINAEKVYNLVNNRHTECYADVSKYYHDSALIGLYHKFKKNHSNEILKYLFKKTERLEGPDPATNRYYVNFSRDHYVVKFFNICSGVRTFELDKRQYDYWLKNQDKLNKYISDMYLPLDNCCSHLEYLFLHHPDRYSRYIRRPKGRRALEVCSPLRHNEKKELISSLDIPIWAKENSWSLIRSSGFSRPSLLHSKMLITKNGLDYANFSVKDFALDNDINLSIFKTDKQLLSEAAVYRMQINIFSGSTYMYYFDTFHPLDLDKFSLSGAATDCGDYVITDLLYEDAIHPLKYYYKRGERNSVVVPKLIKYDETYPSTPEESLDLNCREISEASADGFKIQLQSI